MDRVLVELRIKVEDFLESEQPVAVHIDRREVLESRVDVLVQGDPPVAVAVGGA